jgi:putative transposase
MVAAYIDLNPLRAGITPDNKDYRWCSYAEAVAGDVLAVDGYVRLYQGSNRAGAEVEKLTSDPGAVMDRYRLLMAEEGVEADQSAIPMVQGQRARKRHKRRRGYSREEVEEILERNGKLSRAEVLRCKTRYFTDGAVIGTKAFVNGFYKRVKDQIPGGRKAGAKKMRGIDKIDSKLMYSYRDLQKDVHGS